MALIFGVATLAAALIILLKLAYKRHRSILDFAIFFLGSVASAVFLYVVGGWAFISFYLRWAFGILYISASIFVVFRVSKRPLDSRIRPWWLAGRVFVFLAFAFLDVLYFSSRVYDKSVAVKLKSPFRYRNYYFMQGGNSRLTNLFHRNFSMQRYGFANDIARLYPSGNRARGIAPDNPGGYAIFHDTIISPCSGKVLVSIDSVHNNRIGIFNVKNVHGNHIIIQSDGFRLFLAHFSPGKVFVKVGDSVHTGQPLGLCGNSGFSAEPHLHINALRDYSENDYYSGTSVPILFDGKFYTMNEMVRR